MHIGHVALQVPDLAASVDHAVGTLGLRQTDAPGDGALLTANDKHHELQLTESGTPGVDHVGLEVSSEDELRGVRERAVAAGATILADEPLEPGLAHAIRIEAPLGLVFEVYTGMARSAPDPAYLLGGHARKLGHVTFGVREKDDLVAFLIDVLGFRISDAVGEFNWLRCDPDHHGIAVGSGFPADVMHHYAFELKGWSGMREYLDDLVLQDRRVIYGPGRHGPGYNLFTYLPDPAGAILEAYADLQRIEDDATYTPQDWERHPNGVNLWGPLPPPDFGDYGLPILAAR
jgi:catechol 2,3-dioxygenase